MKFGANIMHLKKLIFILIAGICMPVYALQQSKARTAGNFALAALKKGAGAMKANPYKTAAAVATAVSVGYVEYRRGKHTRLARSLKQAANKLHRAGNARIKTMQDTYATLVKQGQDQLQADPTQDIGAITQALADLDQKIAEEKVNLATDARRAHDRAFAYEIAASAASHETFGRQLQKHYRKYQRMPLDERILVPGAIIVSNLITLGASLIIPRIIVWQYKSYAAYGMPFVTSDSFSLKPIHIKTLEEAMQFGQREKKFGLKFSAGVTSVMTLAGVGMLLYDWIRTRDAAAKAELDHQLAPAPQP